MVLTNLESRSNLLHKKYNTLSSGLYLLLVSFYAKNIFLQFFQPNPRPIYFEILRNPRLPKGYNLKSIS